MLLTQSVTTLLRSVDLDPRPLLKITWPSTELFQNGQPSNQSNQIFLLATEDLLEFGDTFGVAKSENPTVTFTTKIAVVIESIIQIETIFRFES